MRSFVFVAFALVSVIPTRLEARCESSPGEVAAMAEFATEMAAACDCCAPVRRCALPLIGQAAAEGRLSRRCARRAVRRHVRTCGEREACRYYATCGYPVCKPSDEPIPGVDPCTTEAVGEPCPSPLRTCDPGIGCGVRLLCTHQDPTAHGCPISRRDAKRDVVYLDDRDLDRTLDDIRRRHLARYRYKAEPEPARSHLGFLIDDVGESPAVTSDGGHVDLYGYTSMAVAPIQAQQRRIEALEREVSALRQALSRRR